MGTDANILQAYKRANDIAKQGKSLEREIEAYQEVIRIGLSQKQNKEDLKNNMIMFWAYNNVGDAFLKSSRPDKSLDYYNQGLRFARDNLEEISLWNRIAQNYKSLGDSNKWLQAKLKIINNLPDEDKRKAYRALADGIADSSKKAEIYEKALQFISDEDVSFLGKCHNTLAICEILQEIYQQKKDQASWQRVNNLAVKTADLAAAALEERIDEEDDRNKQLKLYSKLVDVELRHRHPDLNRKKCLYRRLAAILQKNEEILVSGVLFSKKTIRKFLRELV